MPAPQIILDLVQRFSDSRDQYRSGHYNEAQLRREFLDPLLTALGWDLTNQQGYAPQYREVIQEASLNIEGQAKAPDYEFRIGQTSKFFVEAKKPAVNIQYDIHPAFQLRRYAWSAHLPLSILTDFEEFAVYDTRIKPNFKDAASVARIFFFRYTDYADKWDEIAAIFSKSAIPKGSFDRYVQDNKNKKGTAEVDDAFLSAIETWRELLARNIALRNPQARTERALNYAVQMTLDRIIFLRICEDRGIEPERQLDELAKAPEVYPRLVNLFIKADQKYNSGLFHFAREKAQTSDEDAFTPSLAIDDKALKQIIGSLYYPESPFAFKVIPVEILGQVYEQFLGKVIRLTPAGQAKVEEKPEVRKAGGVYYTPRYIVDYIVQNTVGKLLEGKTPPQVASLRVVDPACGSGSFLLGAFQYLLDWHLAYYLAPENGGPQAFTRGKSPALLPAGDGGYQLTTAEKKRILTNNIYGVDIDQQAVEVTKLSLLLKLLEEETGQLSLGFERVLPDLGHNIRCGNSLIGWDYFHGQLLADEEEVRRVNPFDWQQAFPEVFAAGGFDAVIGNPPYTGILENKEKNYLKSTYSFQTSSLDTCLIFLEKYHEIIHAEGLLGVIVSNTWMLLINNSSLRNHLTSDYKWLKCVYLKYKVFKAVVDTQILIFQRSRIGTLPNDLVQVDTMVDQKIVFLHNLTGSTILTSGKPINIVLNEKVQTLCREIEAASVPLSELFNVYNGIKPFEVGKGTPPQTRKIVSEQLFVHEGDRPDENWSPLLRGSLIQQYRCFWNDNYWVLYGPWLAAPRDPRIFSANEKIVVRQTGDSLIATIIGKGFICRNNMHIVIAKQEYFSYNLALAILNSKLMDIYYSFMNPEKGEALAEVKKIHVEQIPLPQIKPEHSVLIGRIEAMVSELKRLHANSLETTSPSPRNDVIQFYRKAIDKAVLSLYGFTDEQFITGGIEQQV